MAVRPCCQCNGSNAKCLRCSVSGQRPLALPAIPVDQEDVITSRVPMSLPIRLHPQPQLSQPRALLPVLIQFLLRQISNQGMVLSHHPRLASLLSI